MTLFEYDDAGRPVSMVTVREPEFSASDRVELAMSRRAENEPRSSTGVPLKDATDPRSQSDWDVPLPVTDFAAARLSRAKDAYKKQFPDADMDALLWRVARRSAADAGHEVLKSAEEGDGAS